MRRLIAITLLWLPGLSGASVDADTLALVNSLRTRECPRAAPKPLNGDAKLHAAARSVQNGAHVRDALKSASYRADQSAVIRLRGRLDDAAVRRMLKEGYCTLLTDSDFHSIGIARTERELALVLATPFAPPSAGDSTRISQEVLKLVNEARRKPQRCGSKRMPAVGPLALNPQLHSAALAHARDIARHGKLSHRGSDGSEPADRATRAGYVWKVVGENIASGHLSSAEVVHGWLLSPHHCENIMDPDFTHMAVAFAVEPASEAGIYWAQVFARPR